MAPLYRRKRLRRKKKQACCALAASVRSLSWRCGKPYTACALFPDHNPLQFVAQRWQLFHKVFPLSTQVVAGSYSTKSSPSADRLFRCRFSRQRHLCGEKTSTSPEQRKPLRISHCITFFFPRKLAIIPCTWYTFFLKCKKKKREN